MAVTNIRSVRPTIWIPPIYTANFKVTVERSDGTIDDITDIILSLSVEDGVTEGIGIFEFEIPNPGEEYNNVWTGMEIFRFYSDYQQGDATTLRFRGRIEKPSNVGTNMKCTGRSESLFVVDKTVTRSFTAEDGGQILYDLFDLYGDERYDLTQIPISLGVSLTLAWTDNPFWNCLQEICVATGYDCYIDANLVVKFFLNGSIKNTTDGIVHENNLIDVGDFAPDLQFVKNKIRVYGATVDDAQIIYTANDLTSQGIYGIRVATVDDGNVVTIEQAKDLGEYTLENSTANPPTVGEVTSVMLATIQPGEQLRISSPLQNLPPAFYTTVLYKHMIDENGLKTTVTINKQPKRLAHVLRDRIQVDNQQSNTSGNQFDMDFAWVELFNNDTGSHTDTEITNGVLQLTPGSIGGTWISPSISVIDDKALYQVVIGLAVEDAPNIEAYISGDNGVTWEQVTVNDLVEVVVASGSNFKLKLRLLSKDARVGTATVKYTTKSG